MNEVIFNCVIYQKFHFSAHVHAMFHAVPTASPQNIQAMTMNSSTVLITWLPPIPEHWNGIITAYIVNIFLDDNDTVPQQYTTSTLSVTLVGLHPFATYVVVVAAKTGVGRGPFSSGLRIQTPEDGKSAAGEASDSTKTIQRRADVMKKEAVVTKILY